jgi:hypothetical protein
MTNIHHFVFLVLFCIEFNANGTLIFIFKVHIGRALVIFVKDDQKRTFFRVLKIQNF